MSDKQFESSQQMLSHQESLNYLENQMNNLHYI